MKKPFMSYPRYDPSTSGYGSPRQWRAEFKATMGLDEARSVLGPTRQTPYQILSVAPTARWEEIVTAYRKAAFACHPDRCAIHGLSLAVATEQFKRLQAAYVILESRRPI